MTIYEQIEKLQGERASAMAIFDQRIAALKDEAQAELAAARQQVALLESVLGAPKLTPVAVVARETSPIDETDAGNGVRERESETSTADFLDELADLRARSQAKRARR